MISVFIGQSSVKVAVGCKLESVVKVGELVVVEDDTAVSEENIKVLAVEGKGEKERLELIGTREVGY